MTGRYKVRVKYSTSGPTVAASILPCLFSVLGTVCPIVYLPILQAQFANRERNTKSLPMAFFSPAIMYFHSLGLGFSLSPWQLEGGPVCGEFSP